MSDISLAAVVQMTSRDDVAANLATAERLVRRCVARGASLVVLPENVAFMGPEARKPEVAETFVVGASPDGVIGRAASSITRDAGVWTIWGGLPERADDGRVHNTAAVFSPDGSLVATYRKIHLFDVELSDGTTLMESRGVSPGDRAVTVDTALGRVGLSICYDVRFPELYRRLVDDGATLLTVPAAFTVTTGRDHWHVLLRARAIESQCHVLAAAQWGDHGGGRTTYGHAMIVDPWGTILAECADGEGIAVAEIDAARTARIRGSLPSLRHRRLR